MQVLKKSHGNEMNHVIFLEMVIVLFLSPVFVGGRIEWELTFIS